MADQPQAAAPPGAAQQAPGAPPRDPGRRLLEHLRRLDAAGPDQLSMAVRIQPPPAPTTIAETGVPELLLTRMLLKTMHVGALRTVPELVHALKLAPVVVQALLQGAIDRRLIEVSGAQLQGAIPIVEHVLSERGRDWAADAFAQSQYVGPVPVPLQSYAAQVARQPIAAQAIAPSAVRAALADLVLDDSVVEAIGPALAARRSILLYGAPGNGKSSIAERLARLFDDVIFVPYAIEIDGQIVRVFDAQLHGPAPAEPAQPPAAQAGIRRDDFDERWVACRRPFAIAAGELTLEMLDVRPAERAGFYDAPLHVKAMGGVFVIDDFGRQAVNPKALLDRWIVPLERRIDYLKLQTGKSFSLPFDALIVFSTNIEPDVLMDAAFLRRIPYKIHLPAPGEADYRRIFERAASRHGLQIPDDLVDLAIAELRRRGLPLAGYQPGFVVDQIVTACRFHERPPAASAALVRAALANLSTRTFAPPGAGQEDSPASP
ncbi:MAG: hypothetical protein U1E53_23770 [Dongiaceae bacterium]